MKNYICALSNEIATEPVVSPVSGSVFEKRLIMKYLEANDNQDPINGNKLSADQLIIVNKISISTDLERQSRNNFSMPELIKFVREQFNSKSLQMFDLKKQLIASSKEVEILLNKLNIQNNKLMKYKQAEEESKYLNELNYFKQNNDNVYSNLPSFDNKENVNFASSSINSSNGSSFKGSNNYLTGDHRLTGNENMNDRFHHHASKHLKNNSINHNNTSINYSNHHSSISSGDPMTNLFLNEQYFDRSKFSQSDDLSSPKLVTGLVSPKLINDLISPRYSNRTSPKFNYPNSKFNDLANLANFNDLTDTRSNTIGNNESASSFQKYNKLSYSTEYVNLNSNRLIDRNFRTQSVIIQTDNLFDNELNSMKSCDENLNYRNEHSKQTNYRITPSSSGSLKGFSDNGTLNSGLTNYDSNYINTRSEVEYCNLRDMKEFDMKSFDSTNLTSRRPKSTLTNYENIPIINEDYDLGSSQQSINKLERNFEHPFCKIDKNSNKLKTDKFDKNTKNDTKREQCAKVSKIESWSKDFNCLLNDTLGRKAFTIFLIKEHSNENIEFWESCERYKKLETKEERKKEARMIFKIFFDPNNEKCINIEESVKTSVQKNIKKNEISKVLFDEAQNKIYILMRDHSYKRFLDSDIYKKALDDKDKDKIPTELFNSELPISTKQVKSRKSLIGKQIKNYIHNKKTLK